MRSAILPFVLLATGVPWLTGAAENTAGDLFPPGEIIDRVICRDDPDRTYALYLPSAYTGDGRWPVLMLMDPRGRAMIPLELFKEAAERYGYIVVSSYDTRSDGPRDVNILALRAMLPDIERRLALDVRRHYLVGFSGTARMSWDVATLLPDRVAGIIGVGAGLPSGYELRAELPFVFFGTAGTTDFNHEEMRALDTTLDSLGMPHRFESFEGPHTWPPGEVCTRAVAWLEIQAMHAGLQAPDAGLAGAFLQAEMLRAAGLEEAGAPLEAYTLYRDLAEEFNDLADTAAVAGRAAELAASPAVQAAQARRVELAREHEAYEARFRSFLEELQTAKPPPALIRALRVLDIKALKKQAENDNDPAGARAARQELENVFVFTSFYLPRDFLAQDDARRALAALQIAGEIKPGNARVCFTQARAYARLKQGRKAVQALECAATTGRITAALVENDPDLATLAGEKGFAELLDRLPN